MGLMRTRAAFAGLGLFLALTISGTAQIVNGDFEAASMDPWITYQKGAEVADKGAHGGTYCTAIHPHATIFQKVDGLTEGATYIFSAYVKTDAGAKAQLAVQNYGGKYIAAKLPNAPDYTKISLTFTMGNEGMSAQLMLSNASDSGTLYADDFTLELAPAADASATNAAPSSPPPANK